MTRVAMLVATLVAGLLLLPAAQAQGRFDLGPLPPGQFDFYVLSLTWVPGFCATHRDPAECARGFGFRLHGLWPESVNGYPYRCSSDPLPDDVRAAYAGLFPDPDMIDHEWLTHGTCSGLGPSGFFAKTQSLLGSVTVPSDLQRRANLRPSDAEAIKAAFLAANPGLSAGSLVLACSRHGISEIHVCLGKNGAARDCEGWERAEDTCR